MSVKCFKSGLSGNRLFTYLKRIPHVTGLCFPLDLEILSFCTGLLAGDFYIVKYVRSKVQDRGD